MKWKAKIFCCLLTVCALVRPVVWAQSPSQNAAARALFTEGRNFWDEGKFGEADRKFREAITRFPRAEQSDRTAFYLITTLIKLGRTAEARTEIENFYKNYPQSSWKSDVDEKRLTLNGLPAPLIVRPAGEPGHHFGEPISFARTTEVTVTAPFRLIASPSLEQEVLRQIIERDADSGIQAATKRLKTNSSDPAVIANLGAIANSHSSHAVPFLVNIAGNSSSSPNVRIQAMFWLGRNHSDKEAFGKALIELLKNDDSAGLVANTIGRLNASDRRATLSQIAHSPNADRVAMLERIYRNSSNLQVRAQVLLAAGPVTDAAARTLLGDAFQNDKEPMVRRAAAQALSARKDVDVKALLEILNSMQEGTAK
jgi:tetratricopeptide (TPR) repeat protein